MKENNEAYIAAMRGRNPDNPSERKPSNGRYTQRLEVNQQGTSNTLTGVQKDNLVVEPQVMQIGNIIDDANIGFKNPQRGRIYSDEGLAPAVNCVNGGGQETKILADSADMPSVESYDSEPQFRIRKLTPRECFRLMGVREHYIDKIQNADISNSQQYKLAGNSIVVDNLFHIFRKLLIDTDTQEQEQLSLF